MSTYRKRVGYGKIGRAMPLTQDSWGFVGGDDEPPLLLRDLATRNPDVEFVLVGRNSLEDPQEVGFPENVTNPWIEWMPQVRAAVKGLVPIKSVKDDFTVIQAYDDITLKYFDTLDDIIVWWGQHGSSNMPIPKTASTWDDLTKPQDSFIFYASYFIRGINYWRRQDPLNREEIHLIADARNYLKLRDLKWPTRNPILGQFNMVKNVKHERFGDTRTPEETGFTEAKALSPTIWTSKQEYTYSRLELCGVMPWHIDSYFEPEDAMRGRFGLFINEARAYVKNNRLDALRDYVLPLSPTFVHGTWSKDSLEKLQTAIFPASWEDYYPLLRSVMCTMTTPSSGSGWATTKPWQAFAVGTVCFFHPEYDTQDNILGDAHPDLRSWLRVSGPEDLKLRVEFLCDPANLGVWRWLIQEQRNHYDKAVREAKHLTMIEERINR